MRGATRPKNSRWSPQMLLDRNTVQQVAEHWGCSTDTVFRRIRNGSLPCIRDGRVVRIRREDVLTYEVSKCSNSLIQSSGKTPLPASGKSSTAHASERRYRRALENSGQRKSN